MKMKKGWVVFLRSLLFIGIAGGTGFGSFLITPNKTKKIELPSPKDDEGADTYFSKLVNKVTGTFDENSEEKLAPFKASFKDFEITWKDENALTNNVISIVGDAYVDLANIDFTLDTKISFNSRNFDLGISYVDSSFYLAAGDIKLKATNESLDTVQTELSDLFSAIGGENGSVYDGTTSFIDALLGKLDIDELLAKTGISFNAREELIDEENVAIYFDLGIKSILDEESKPSQFTVSLILNPETLMFKRVDLGTINLGDVTIKGSLEFDDNDVKVYKLDDPTYANARTGFVDVVNYLGFAKSVLNVLDTRKAGLDLSLNVNKENEDGTKNFVTSLNSSFNIDFSGLFDLSNFFKDPFEFIFGEGEEEVGEVNEESLTDKLFNTLKLDGSVSVKDSADDEYSNIVVAYFEKNGYLAFNDSQNNSSILKAKISLNAVNELIAKIPTLLSKIGIKAETIKLEGIFDDILNSKLVSDIKDGNYEDVLDVINYVKDVNGHLEVSLNLEYAGLGKGVEFVLSLGKTYYGKSQILAVSAHNVSIGGFSFDLDLNTKDYSLDVINQISSDDALGQYLSLDFASGVVSQVSNLLETRRSGFYLEGSMLDDESLGFTFAGNGQFDYDEKIGFGSIVFDQYKTSSTKVSASHKVDLYVDDSSEDLNEKIIKFAYRDTLKGKFTIQTVVDIYDLLMEIMNSDDPRFSKFFDPLKDSLIVGTITEVIDNKNYEELLTVSFIKEITSINDGNGMKIVINKDLFGMDSDLSISVNLVNNELESIAISDLRIDGKNINVKIGLREFDEEMSAPLNVEDQFMDFSQIRVLLQFGINSTKLNVYHLTANVNISLSILGASVKLDVYIYVDGATTKVYGHAKEIKINALVGLFITNHPFSTVTSEFVFEPDYEAGGNDIGGYFHILKKAGKNNIYYRSTSANFAENLVQYLMYSMLDIKKDTVESIGNIDSSGSGSGEEVDTKYENLFGKDGFTYVNDNGTDIWDICIDLGVLTNSSSFGLLDLTLKGIVIDDVGYFSHLDVETSIKASFITIKLTASFDLVNPNSTINEWPESITTRYETIIGSYNNMSAEKKATFDAKYMNNPYSDYTL